MKACLVLFRTPPYGCSLGREGLDAVLMASAFTRVSCLFLDDGVFQLVAQQVPASLQVKAWHRAFELLRDYGVGAVYCCGDSLRLRGLDPAQLLLAPEPIGIEAQRALIEQHEFILTF